MDFFSLIVFKISISRPPNQVINNYRSECGKQHGCDLEYHKPPVVSSYAFRNKSQQIAHVENDDQRHDDIEQENFDKPRYPKFIERRHCEKYH